MRSVTEFLFVFELLAPPQFCRAIASCKGIEACFPEKHKKVLTQYKLEAQVK